MEKFICQIYEIQTPDEAETLIEMGVDHIGSVLLSEETWKVSSIKDTIQMVAQSGAKSSLIPLFNTPDAIFGVLEYYQPDIVHFCENLTASNQIIQELIGLQKSVRQKFPQIRIMRSIPIAQKGMADQISSLELARMFEPHSDLLLTDTLILKSSQPVPGFVGITGKTCDWDVAAKLVKQSKIPVILAGGLSPDNVRDGILYTRPAGADSCTGTNARDDKGNPIRFKKDLAKVRQFIEQCRQAMAE